MPRPYTSAGASALAALRSASGARKPKVPNAAVRVPPVESGMMTKSKSVRWGSPAWFSKIFAGLTSRWMMRCRCA